MHCINLSKIICFCFWFTACLNLLFFICYLLCRDLVCPFTNRINIDPRKSPKLSRATQEISRSPRLPIRKPSIGSPSLTRREFPLDDITQVKVKLLYLKHSPYFPQDQICLMVITSNTLGSVGWLVIKTAGDLCPPTNNHLCVWGGGSVLVDDKLTHFYFFFLHHKIEIILSVPVL